jgi:hypothetical protein
LSNEDEQNRIQEVAQKFADDFAANPDKFVAEYRNHPDFGNYLCTDNALELCSEYKNAPKEQKAELADALGKTASGIIRATFDKMLSEQPEQGKENMVIFVAGGAGAGKTSVIKGVQSVESLKEACHIVYEVVLGLNEEKIQKTLDAGKWAGILYVHRPIENAAAGVLVRAEQEGRLPSFDYVCEGHFGCPQQLIALCEKFENHPTFSYVIGDNSKENGLSELILIGNSLDFIRTNAYRDIKEAEEQALKGVQDVIKKREEQNEPINESLVRQYIGSRAAENETEISRNRADGNQQSERNDSGGDQEAEEGGNTRELGRFNGNSEQRLAEVTNATLSSVEKARAEQNKQEPKRELSQTEKEEANQKAKEDLKAILTGAVAGAGIDTINDRLPESQKINADEAPKALQEGEPPETKRVMTTNDKGEERVLVITGLKRGESVKGLELSEEHSRMIDRSEKGQMVTLSIQEIRESIAQEQVQEQKRGQEMQQQRQQEEFQQQRR